MNTYTVSLTDGGLIMFGCDNVDIHENNDLHFYDKGNNILSPFETVAYFKANEYKWFINNKNKVKK